MGAKICFYQFRTKKGRPWKASQSISQEKLQMFLWTVRIWEPHFGVLKDAY